MPTTIVPVDGGGRREGLPLSMAGVLFLVILAGVGSQYSPGVMEQVVANRQAGDAWVSLPAELPDVDGYIAVADCAELGQVWWIRPRDSACVGQPGCELGGGCEVGPRPGQWERHLVVDCAAPDDGTLEWMAANNVVLEVSYETAERWQVVGRGVGIDVGKRVEIDYEGGGLVP